MSCVTTTLTEPADPAGAVAVKVVELETVTDVAAIVEEGQSKIFMLQSSVAGATLRRAKIERPGVRP